MAVPSDKTFDTFLDLQRRKLKLSHVDMWKTLKWSKQRYWQHQKTGAVLSPKDVALIATLRRCKLKTIAKEYVQFYFTEAVEMQKAS